MTSVVLVLGAAEVWEKDLIESKHYLDLGSFDRAAALVGGDRAPEGNGLERLVTPGSKHDG
jgi:hypothetical protein